MCQGFCETPLAYLARAEIGQETHYGSERIGIVGTAILRRVYVQCRAEVLSTGEVSIRPPEPLDQRGNRSDLRKQDVGVQIEAHLTYLGGHCDHGLSGTREGVDCAPVDPLAIF